MPTTFDLASYGVENPNDVFIQGGKPWRILSRNASGQVTSAEEIQRNLYPAITLPTSSAPGAAPLAPVQAPMIDPLLSADNILSPIQAAQAAFAKPTMTAAREFIEPSIPLLTQKVNEQAGQQKAAAQSDFLNRGITGSSTEVQTITRDIPAAANKALVEGINQLLLQAIPLAQNEKSMAIDTALKTASLSTNLRQVLGDEAFKTLDLNQRRELANQDVQLKLKLADVEMKFQAAMKQAEFAFTAAENDKDRAVAAQEYQYLLSERKKARQGAFMSSLSTLVGLGIGVALAPATGGASTLAAYGGLGATAGGGFANLFMLD